MPVQQWQRHRYSSEHRNSLGRRGGDGSSVLVFARRRSIRGDPKSRTSEGAASRCAARFFRVGGVSPIWGVGPRCDGGPFSADWSPLASSQRSRRTAVDHAVQLSVWRNRPTPKVPDWAVATPRDWTGGPVQSSHETRVGRAWVESLQVRRRDKPSKKAGPADRSSSIRGLALTTSRRCRPARRARRGLPPPRRPGDAPARRAPCAATLRPGPLSALPDVRPPSQ